eukprot:CAMPEP_0171248840 /NCGR_PEP_ID=MMETSP0790-20130122/49230_1 /TAXON_ID=2925 /ORGANISM="Alexandrium catenella, Strain OF101" /LENGTH=75 /DNA_ID=CAMNT_0011716317 /DNA_START=23 /DNA_END=246 /DNA_ORIENTATION=+
MTDARLPIPSRQDAQGTPCPEPGCAAGPQGSQSVVASRASGGRLSPFGEARLSMSRTEDNLLYKVRCSIDSGSSS